MSDLPTRDLPPAGHPTDTAADPESETGGRQPPVHPDGGRYVLGDEIARGGMGVVYRATDTALGREVAVKVLRDGFAPGSGAARRFADEARITGQLQHPGIPPVHDLGTLPDGRPFLAMKLIKGETLDDLIPASGGREPPDGSKDQGAHAPRSPRQAIPGSPNLVAVFEAVCQAVGYAHAHGVVHRDLKPANVMVGAFGEVQVMDWGLAKVLASGGRQAPDSSDDPEVTTAPTEVRTLRDSDGTFTQAGSVLGTPAFMPPEQAAGAAGRADARSDVFGLGAVLAVILTGEPPFAGGSAETTRVKAATGDVAACFARLDACGADPELLAVCKRCLAPKPADRPADAGAVAAEVAALRAAADDRARQAERDKLAAEVRRRAVVRAAGVVAAVLLVGIAGTTVGLVRADRARRDAEAAQQAEADRAEGERRAKEEAEAAGRREVDQRRAAEEAKTRADDNFALARKAVNDYLTRVADDPELKDRTDFTGLRKRLLEAAVPFLQTFADQQGDTPAAQAERGRIWAMLGHVGYEAGQMREAEKAYRKARDAYGRAAAGSPGTFAYRSALIEATGQHAYCLVRIGRNLEAQLAATEEVRLAEQGVTDFPTEPNALHVRAVVYGGSDVRGPGRAADALRDLRELVRREPDSVPFQSSLASALDHHAGALAKAGQREDAAAAYREEIEIVRKLVASQPDDPGFRHHLANGLFNYAGMVYYDRPAQALPLWQEAAGLLRQLVVDFPGNARYRHMLARSQHAAGEHLASLRRLPEAETALREAVLLMEQLPESYFREVRRWRLADFTADLAGVLAAQERWDEAGRAAGRAVDLMADAPFVWFVDPQIGGTVPKSLAVLVRAAKQRGREAEGRARVDEVRGVFRSRKQVFLLLNAAVWQVRDGDPERAVADAEVVAAMWPNRLEILYDAACVLALASARTERAEQADRHAARAVELLQRAIAAGWQDRAHMDRDTDLDALRSRADFRKVIGSLPYTAPPPREAKR